MSDSPELIAAMNRLLPFAAKAEQRQRDATMAILRAGYLLGFMASGEGSNGEFPEGANPLVDQDWLKRREAILMDYIGLPEFAP